MSVPKYLVTAEEMRALDATSIQKYGIPGVVLMENAGRSTFQILSRHFKGNVRGLKAAVIAGPGNNGGDGYVIARYLINHGAEVNTFLLSPREKIRGDALTNLEILEKMTPHVIAIGNLEALERASASWRESDIIVDALLGTGLNAEVRSPYREAIQEINRAAGIKIAVDLPSGLDADSGRVLGVAVKTDLTAVYGFRKLGMSLYPGLQYCGKIEVVDISIPVCAVEKNPPKALFYDEPEAGHYVGARANPEAHKGTFGHLLIVGGSPGKTGAPVMAAKAASRIGAGLVTVGIPASLNSILEDKLTEEMTEPLPETVVPGYLGEAAADRILSLAEGKRCMVLGPGLSTHEGMTRLINRLLAEYNGWVLIDADGLNALASSLDSLRQTASRIVLTPHPGEMARLAGISTQQVQQDRVGIARKIACDHAVWVVLKGARTLTACPDGTIFVNSTGNPWMASGGQGDVLSGILGGLLAQGIPPEKALPFGVYVHGLAADRLVQRDGPRPVVAGDIIEELSQTLGDIGAAAERDNAREVV
jgi:NAD(P)H-hydrate epimerase